MGLFPLLPVRLWGSEVVDVRELHSTDAPVPHLQPSEEEGDAEALFPPRDVIEHLERIGRLNIGDEWKYSEIPKKSRKIMEELDLLIM